jgi:K(+)-stimulated pyrophosphate-energized sodium pump
MAVSYYFSSYERPSRMMPAKFGFAAPIFAFGLVAFGFLGMGPVTIAVDSFGPVTDNAQSVYELSQIEGRPGIAAEIEKDFGFKPDFENAKHQLEKGDGAGNTFKATAKPVLIGTAVVGATTMVFGIIMLLQKLYENQVASGVAGPSSACPRPPPRPSSASSWAAAVIYWFTGASCQAVVTGAYRAVVYIKEQHEARRQDRLRPRPRRKSSASARYAQKGMVEHLHRHLLLRPRAAVLRCRTSSSATSIGMAFFGLFQAIFMANAGGAWDNAKKIVEVDLKPEEHPLHAATVVGDTVGDPFKDTSSVALNPVIKFTTLFGLLAVEIAVNMRPEPQALPRRRSIFVGRPRSSSTAASTACASR